MFGGDAPGLVAGEELGCGEELGRGPSPRHALEIRRRRASGRFPNWSDNAARICVQSVVPEE